MFPLNTKIHSKSKNCSKSLLKAVINAFYTKDHSVLIFSVHQRSVFVILNLFVIISSHLSSSCLCNHKIGHGTCTCDETCNIDDNYQHFLKEIKQIWQARNLSTLCKNTLLGAGFHKWDLKIRPSYRQLNADISILIFENF